MNEFNIVDFVSIMSENGFTQTQITKMLQHAERYNATHFKMNRSSIDILFDIPNSAFNVIRCHREDNGYYNFNIPGEGIVAGVREIWSKNYNSMKDLKINFDEDFTLEASKVFFPL